MLEGKKISAMLPKSWKKLFNDGIIIPTEMRFCNKCYDRTMCNRCNNQINENKVFEANLSLLKRQSPNEFVHMLPYLTEEDDFIRNKLPYLLSYLLSIHKTSTIQTIEMWIHLNCLHQNKINKNRYG